MKVALFMTVGAAITKEDRIEALNYLWSDFDETVHSVRRLFAVHLVPNGKALVNSVGHVRNENEQ